MLKTIVHGQEAFSPRKAFARVDVARARQETRLKSNNHENAKNGWVYHGEKGYDHLFPWHSCSQAKAPNVLKMPLCGCERCPPPANAGCLCGR